MPFAVVALLGLTAARAAATEQPTSSAPSAVDEESVTPPESHRPRKWSAAVSVSTYVVPDTRNYAQPTLAADYERLHLEARYDYEALDTGSLWLGCNFGLGESLSLELTPMVGGVFGHTSGIAPGYELTLAYWKLELYSEGEYLFDTDDSSGNFAYTWSEFSLSPLEWLRVGMVAQRTRAHRTDIDIQRGPLLGVSYRSISFTTYVFNPEQSPPTFVLALGATF